MCINIHQHNTGRSQLASNKFSIIKSLALILARLTADFASALEWLLTHVHKVPKKPLFKEVATDLLQEK